MAIPKGVRYQYREGQSADHQVFPEEYFSGADVSIYFGDVWVDDVSSIQFEMEERVLPIYGYASHTWDAIARGQRQIQGTFTIAFREAGYLNTMILDHIAQLPDAKPALAWLMDEERTDASPPQWYAKARERIEELLTRYHSPVKTYKTETRWVIPTWPDMEPGQPAPQWALKELARALSQKKDPSGKPYLSDSGAVYTALGGDLLQAVKNLQVDQAGTDDPWGKVGTWTKKALASQQEVTVPVYDQSRSQEGAVSPEQETKSRATRYEAQVWGLSGGSYNGIPLRAMRRFKPYWYSGEHTQALSQKGFDIYFSFGALDEYVASTGYQPLKSVTYDQPVPPGGNGITFPTTVRALRNVQIKGIGMLLDASGKPVEEVYQFIAQDLD